MPETRVIGANARKIGGGAASAPAPAPPPQEAPASGRRRGRIVVVVVAVALVLAAGVFFFLRPAESTAVPVEPEPEPGVTVAVDPVNINLAEGRYLRLGFAIELVAEAEEIATAQARDIAIALYSGRTVDEVNDAGRRSELKAELTDQLAEAYAGEVMAVYLTDFVTQ